MTDISDGCRSLMARDRVVDMYVECLGEIRTVLTSRRVHRARPFVNKVEWERFTAEKSMEGFNMP